MSNFSPDTDISLPDSPEPTTTDYVKIFNDSFKLVSQQMNWDAAKMHWESDGAKLASLRNQWSQAYVELLGLNVKGPMWIGINKMEVQDRKLLKLKILEILLCQNINLIDIIDGFYGATCFLLVCP